MKIIIFLFEILFIQNFQLKKKLQQSIEIIPEEIVYPTEIVEQHSPYIYDYNKFNSDLESQRISKYENPYSHKGKIYYKSPGPYYGPQTTYRAIPKMNDIKFETPVTIEELQLFPNDESIRNELQEAERQLSNMLLFTDQSKSTGEIKLKDNYPWPYYDTTYEDKILKIKILKKRILDLRKKLNIKDEEVNFYVQVKNNTFPKNVDDIMKHLNESYYHPAENFDSNNKFINGNLTEIDDIYNIRGGEFKKSSSKFNKTQVLKDVKSLFTTSERENTKFNFSLIVPVENITKPQLQPQQNISKIEVKRTSIDNILNFEHQKNNVEVEKSKEKSLPIISSPVQIHQDETIKENKQAEKDSLENASQKDLEKSDDDDINNLL